MSAPDDGAATAEGRRDDLRTLGLLPTASPEDVLQAYMKLRRALRKDSPAMRSAASEQERCDMLQRIETAYRRLCSQAGLPLQGRETSPAPVPAARAPQLRVDASRSAHSTPSRALDPPLDMHSRPSPFRARPSRPLP